MLRKGSTATGSRNNLSEDEDYDPISTHSYGLSSKASGGGACGGASSKNEEDRHRRTIIIEKKNNSYGFTLQSYGIHYKREQELEMLTYVDHVSYDGPAYKSGMREGDVILSINGVDMEKADHSALVAFIKDCDTRMRMVVLFEDCVRKVSLHMRYIHLQNLLQNKVTELEALLQREREILEGKWKTHSLPARKKASQNVESGAGTTANGSNYVDDIIYPGAADNKDANRRALANKTNTLPITRTAISTENIGKASAAGGGLENFTPNAQVLLSYQYMDPTSRSNLKSSNSSGIDSTDYLTRDDESAEPLNYYSLKTTNASKNSINNNSNMDNMHNHQLSHNQSDPNLNQPRSNCSTLNKDQQQQMQRRDSENPNHQSRHSQYYSNLQEKPPQQQPKEHKFVNRCRQSYYCNPCMGGMDKATVDAQNGGGDNVSLDAYDLAGSPSMCCDPIHQCVPIRRRRSKNHHQHANSHHHGSRESVNHQQQQQQQQDGQQPQQHKCHHNHQQKHKHHKYGKGEEGVGGTRPQRPKSQSNLPSNHQLAQYQKAPHATRYYDHCAAAERCSLHSCSHNDCCPSTTGSYCTSLSADTLNDWQDQESIATPNHSGKNVKVIMQGPNSAGGQMMAPPVQCQQQFQAGGPPHSQMVTRFYHHSVQVQPAGDYQYQQSFMQKPKSWDNLSAKAVGGYGYGYEYVTAPGGQSNSNSLKYSAGQQMEPHSMCGYRVHPQQQQQQHSVSCTNSGHGGGVRKTVYQHYGMKGSAGSTDPAYGGALPCQHIIHSQQQTTTTSTTIISSTTGGNKALDKNGMMVTKCIKGDHCTAGNGASTGYPTKKN